MMQSPVQQKGSSRGYHHSVPNEPSHQATRVAVPEMGSRVDDLNIRRNQTSGFTLIVFL